MMRYFWDKTEHLTRSHTQHQKKLFNKKLFNTQPQKNISSATRVAKDNEIK